MNDIGSAHAAATTAAPTVIRWELEVSMLVCRAMTRRCHIPKYISPAGSYFSRIATSRPRFVPK
jgi:hypothetical protein